jgi:DNA recombination protein RmuC
MLLLLLESYLFQKLLRGCCFSPSPAYDTGIRRVMTTARAEKICALPRSLKSTGPAGGCKAREAREAIEKTGHRGFSAAPLIFAQFRTGSRRIFCEEGKAGRMLLWIAGLIALILGLLIGFLVRNSSASAQIAAARAEKLPLEQRSAELTRDLGAARSDLARLQAESAARAGFEALAVERGKTIDEMRPELQKKVDAERSLSGRVEGLESDLRNERQNTAEKLALLESAKKTLSDQFQALAADILDQKSKTFSEGSQKQLDTLLNPLREQIKDFRSKVEEAQKENLVGRTELTAELKQLRDLNDKLSTEAHSLSTALRQDTQKQGHWGERILLQILENSGLQKDVHYTYQQSFSVEDDESGQPRKQQTDVIVRLPEGRRLIIDSKVTLNAYDDYDKAVDEKGREDALKRLLKSFRDHYTALAERNYQRIGEIQSPDFVVLFAPLEPAFMLALRKDESIWEDAYQRGVLLAGPTTILFVIRIVENLWRQEQQAKNVAKVMERGEKLYDKFVGFVEDLEMVGSKISDADQSYKEALKKLTLGRENLVRQVEMLRELGLKPKKRLKAKFLEEAGAEDSELLLTAGSSGNEDEPA